MASYLHDRVQRIVMFMRDVSGYDEGARLVTGSAARQVQGVHAPAVELEIVQSIVRARAESFLGDVGFSLMYVACTVLMDAYLLCRMLYYMTRPNLPAGSCVMVYAGDAHIQYYLDFFVNYLSVTPTICSPNMAPGSNAPGAFRCVDVSAGKCSPQALRSVVRSMVPAGPAARGKSGHAALSASAPPAAARWGAHVDGKADRKQAKAKVDGGRSAKAKAKRSGAGKGKSSVH